MWYSYSSNDHYNKLIKYAMVKQASAIDELWRNLNSSGVLSQIGISDKNDFVQKMLQKDPAFIQSISEGSINLQEQQKKQIQQSYANYISGRILAEEIGKVRQKAAMEGREPSVAELRAARMNANKRLSDEGIFAEGLGMPSQIHVGRRGPLGKIKLKPIEVPTGEKITDPDILKMADKILQEEFQRTKAIVKALFDEGKRDSPLPTAADMRTAIMNANQRLSEGLKYRIGTRGPIPSRFELNRNIENSKEYYEWKERQKKKENLGLSDVLDVEPGNIAVPRPSDPNEEGLSPEEQAINQMDQESFDENLEIIQAQSNYPVMPPVHPPTCRCRIVSQGKTFYWKTAGDDRVCEECKYHAAEFNKLRNI